MTSGAKAKLKQTKGSEHTLTRITIDKNHKKNTSDVVTKSVRVEEDLNEESPGYTPSFKNKIKSPQNGSSTMREQSLFSRALGAEKSQHHYYSHTETGAERGTTHINEDIEVDDYEIENYDTLPENEQFEQIQLNNISDGVEYYPGGVGRGSSLKKAIKYQSRDFEMKSSPKSQALD